MSNISEIKSKTKNLIRFGLSEQNIIRSLSKDFSSVVELEDIVKDVCATYPNYSMIQKVMRSKIVKDIEGDTNKLYIVDLVYKKISTADKTVLMSMFSPKFNLNDRIYSCRFRYEPLQTKLLIQSDDGEWTFNTYNPPFWQRDYFYSQGKIPIPKLNKIPELYHRYFINLVDGDKASYDYILDWTANGLKSRNFCILTTIGAPGIGKGVYGTILRELIGRENYYEGGDRMFKGTFNSQLADKRFIYCDEFSIKNTKEEDRVKQVVNDTIEIERKGVDAFYVKNHANFYMSSNNLNSLKIGSDDRRFSVINLTDRRLLETFSPAEIEQLKASENIEKLAYFLWHRKVDERKMLKVFKSKRTEEVRASVLLPWQEWLLEEYAIDFEGRSVPLTDAGDAVEEEFGSRFRPGRGAFKSIEKYYPEKLNVFAKKENKKTKWYIKFPEIREE